MKVFAMYWERSPTVNVGTNFVSASIAIHVQMSQLATVDKWGVEEIENRQKTLAGLAVKTWPLD